MSLSTVERFLKQYITRKERYLPEYITKFQTNGVLILVIDHINMLEEETGIYNAHNALNGLPSRPRNCQTSRFVNSNIVLHLAKKFFLISFPDESSTHF